ncbi:MAG: TetR/AcrR family transcriptional regulator [Phaeovulum sp.]|uniref:TetR/AcrR family transcriptional regulator n=1 Tax=Phaeovulum sp. TaxID=2934796 RepID=UPI002730C501|nr:TetR/AcrR family transcriptional regulator [Phaeovulum sp.]MDP2062933.1 TetR/AcrR family transcriptional regulator [Phaeovulum sp.]MDP3862087.1 TetR/AcrR family transcriptional regulator [Phaeovulum sp.]
MSSDVQNTPEAPADRPPSARERILDAAGPLFYREGFRAVGVDRVIAEAGVAKATFYNHFPSKDDLIVAWIERAEGFSAAALPPDDGPTPLTAYVAAMLDVARAERCLGCTFQNTAAEFSARDHPAHAAALAVKRRVIAELERRAVLQALPEPKAVAQRLFLLLEGVWAAVRMFGPDAPLDTARDAARRLIG